MTDMNIKRVSFDGIDSTFRTGMTGHVQKLQFEPDTPGVNFKQTIANVLQSVNTTVGAPDEMMREAMTTGAYDVHDVMIANAKAELAVNMTTQVATKVIQAYDRILQIQI